MQHSSSNVLCKSNLMAPNFRWATKNTINDTLTRDLPTTKGKNHQQQNNRIFCRLKYVCMLYNSMCDTGKKGYLYDDIKI